MWTCPTGRLSCGVFVLVANRSSPTKKTRCNGCWEVSLSAAMCRGVVANMVVPLSQLDGRRVPGGGPPGVYSKHHGIRSWRCTGWPERSGIRTLFQHTVQHTMGSLTGRLACTECPSLRGLNGTPEWIRTTDLLLRRQRVDAKGQTVLRPGTREEECGEALCRGPEARQHCSQHTIQHMARSQLSVYPHCK